MRTMPCHAPFRLTWILILSAGAVRAQDLVYERPVAELQAEMTAGRLTSVHLVDLYRARVAAYDHQGPSLNSIITLNPRARADAQALDDERKAGRVDIGADDGAGNGLHGFLHGAHGWLFSL